MSRRDLDQSAATASAYELNPETRMRPFGKSCARRSGTRAGAGVERLVEQAAVTSAAMQRVIGQETSHLPAARTEVAKGASYDP